MCSEDMEMTIQIAHVHTITWQTQDTTTLVYVCINIIPHFLVAICMHMGTTSSPSNDKRPASSVLVTLLTPKSRLNEYFAKMYKGEAKPEYETTKKSGGGFRSTVTCRDIGCAVGEGSSKNAAEHDAASKILTKLQNWTIVAIIQLAVLSVIIL